MRSSLFLAMCLTLAGAAEAQDLNVITGVEVRTEGNTVVVTVKGSKPPNFTTFSMADPARFVIDLSEAKFQGVPEDLRVDDGVIRVIKNLAYGTGASAIARVMLAFSLDVEPPDVQTDGTSLVVKVLRPASPAVASTPAGPAGAAAPVVAPAAAAVPDAAAVAARAEAEEAARREALAREQRESEAREQARLASESSAKEREAQARAEADARAREAEKVAAEQAAAERAATAAAEARRAEIKARIAAEESQARKASEAAPVAAAVPSAAPAPPAESQAARAEAEADARARREVDEALAAQQAAEARTVPAAAPPPVHAEPAAAPAAAPPPVHAEPAAAPAAAPPPVFAAPAAAPGAPPVAAVVAAPPEARPAAPAMPAKLQAVGFKQLPTVSRVFVKTSATPRFTITDVGDDVVRLEVENTRASRRNDTRPLDTSFFPSAVAMITPSKQGTSYVVDIKLRKRVPYQQSLEGSLLSIDFERPPGEASTGDAVTPGGTAAPAGSAGEASTDNQQGLMVSPEQKADGAEPGEAEPATEPAPKQ